MTSMDIHIVSFGTTGASRHFRDYSKHLARIEATVLRLGLTCTIYTQESPAFKESVLGQNAYPMRKGAGYWSWKPDLILDAAYRNPQKLILYLDADWDLRSVPDEIDLIRNSHSGLSLIRIDHKVVDWTSKRCLDFFSLDKLNDSLCFVASVILLDASNRNALSAMIAWKQAMQNYRLLLDPFFTTRQNHRHDQSILNCLVVKNVVRCIELPQITYVEGVSSESSYESAWLRTVRNSTPRTMRSSILKMRSTIFAKFELFKFIVHNSVFRKFHSSDPKVH